MSFINPQTKEINCKIVYYGPPLSGKTTNLREIYKKTSSDKKKKIISIGEPDDRTLFFDFLPLSVGKVKDYTIRFHLYTVPGQSQLDTSRKVILKGVDGVVFVADSQVEKIENNLESWRDLQNCLADQEVSLESLPFVVQFNKRDLKTAVPVKELKGMFNGFSPACFEATAIQGRGVMESFQALAKQVLRDLRKRPN